MSSPTLLAFPCLTPPILSIWSSSGAWTFPGGKAVIWRIPALRSVSDSWMLMFCLLLQFVLFPSWINGSVNVYQPLFFLYLMVIDVYIFAPTTCFIHPSTSILFLFSYFTPFFIPANQSISLHPFSPWLFAFPHFTSVFLHSLSLWVPNAAVVGADVWCGACGGGGSARIKPQSRNRSEAA